MSDPCTRNEQSVVARRARPDEAISSILRAGIASQNNSARNDVARRALFPTPALPAPNFRGVQARVAIPSCALSLQHGHLLAEDHLRMRPLR